MTPPPDQIAEEILRQVSQRGREKSICPSEVARALVTPEAGAWQSLMRPVRQAAIALAREGQIDILRKGHKVTEIDNPDAMRGVIRLRGR